jgi:hypothetical protein
MVVPEIVVFATALQRATSNENLSNFEKELVNKWIFSPGIDAFKINTKYP